MTTFTGELVIDHERGVIYFNSSNDQNILRISNLPKIPAISHVLQAYDIDLVNGTNWTEKNSN